MTGRQLEKVTVVRRMVQKTVLYEEVKHVNYSAVLRATNKPPLLEGRVHERVHGPIVVTVALGSDIEPPHARIIESYMEIKR